MTATQAGEPDGLRTVRSEVHWWTLRYDLCAHVDALPCRVLHRVHWLRTAIGAAATAASLAFTVYRAVTIRDFSWENGVPLLIILTVILAMATARMVLTRSLVTFTEQDVRLRARNGLLRSQWAEPLESYVGIVCHRSPGLGLSRHGIVAALWLQHRTNRKRSVVLLTTRSAKQLRDTHRRHARLFGLPALFETADGFSEMSRPGLLGGRESAVTCDPSAEVADLLGRLPEGGLSVGLDGDALVISTGQSLRRLVAEVVLPWRDGLGLPWVGCLGLGGIGLLALVLNALLISLLAGDVGLLLGTLKWQAIVFVVALAIGLAVARLLKEELHVTAAEVRKCWRWRLGSFRSKTAQAADVLEVAVRPRMRPKDPETVQIIGQEVTVHFGLGLSTQHLEWVRDCIIAVISQPPAPDAGRPAV